ncbi:MAG: hypothetical protein Q4D33_07755, partial [Prevotellaceae bacterium]|nr:hypothetical protein [Prevotellaceae bacterium]
VHTTDIPFVLLLWFLYYFYNGITKNIRGNEKENILDIRNSGDCFGRLAFVFIKDEQHLECGNVCLCKETLATGLIRRVVGPVPWP